MGFNLSVKTKSKASLKLFNQISSYLFEQEFEELRGFNTAKSALEIAKKELLNIINKSK